MNPFDDPEGEFLVLRNDEDQHSFWPSFASVPAGWEVVHGPADHASCSAYVDSAWTDITPRSARR